MTTGQLTLEELALKMSKRPAEILGIAKGTLEPGRLADIVIINPEQEKMVDPAQFYSKGKNTPFVGRILKGWPEMVIKGGRIVLKQGVLV